MLCTWTLHGTITSSFLWVVVELMQCRCECMSVMGLSPHPEFVDIVNKLRAAYHAQDAAYTVKSQVRASIVGGIPQNFSGSACDYILV